jgi:transcriptional regulator with XRE-family HTH domain
MNSTARPNGGAFVRAMRQRCRLSQLELAQRAGVSQKHLSRVETGRARVGRDTLLALLEATNTSLADQNSALLAAGYAPAHQERSLDSVQMAPVREVLRRLLAMHEPAPAFVLDAAWNVLEYNQGVIALIESLGLPRSMLAGQPNMLRSAFGPQGLRHLYINSDQVCAHLWARAQREAAQVPALHAIVEELRATVPKAAHVSESSDPVLVVRLRGRSGELRFISTFTTFGAPIDITAASLRVEFLFPIAVGVAAPVA